MPHAIETVKQSYDQRNKPWLNTDLQDFPGLVVIFQDFPDLENNNATFQDFKDLYEPCE